MLLVLLVLLLLFILLALLLLLLLLLTNKTSRSASRGAISVRSTRMSPPRYRYCNAQGFPPAAYANSLSTSLLLIVQ